MDKIFTISIKPVKSTNICRYTICKSVFIFVNGDGAYMKSKECRQRSQTSHDQSNSTSLVGSSCH